MKRIITLILMVTILVTFTQKVTALTVQSTSEMRSTVNCPMPIGLDKLQLDKRECSGNQMAHSIDCQSDCDSITVAFVLYFRDDDHSIYQPRSKLAYQTGDFSVPYYFPESLYRPPSYTQNTSESESESVY